MRAQTSKRRDLAGKQHDEISLQEEAFQIALTAEPSAADSVRSAVARALSKYAVSPRRRDKMRDFIVFLGTTTSSTGQDLICICLRTNISSRVTDLLFEELTAFNCVDSGRYPMLDLCIEPLFRYTDNKLIVYTSESKPSHELPENYSCLNDFGLSYETRSARLIRPTALKRPKYNTLPPGRSRAFSQLHSLSTYQDVIKTLDTLIRGINQEPSDHDPPFGYSRFRRFCTTRMGICIFETSLPGDISGFLRIGSISIASSGEPCARVHIAINNVLHPDLKYVALAHEIGHFRVHFQFMLLSALSFDLIAKEPRMLTVLWNIDQAAATHFSDMEHEADIYSSYLLLPPWSDQLFHASRGMLVGDAPARPQDLIWHYLSPFFPTQNLGHTTWTNYFRERDRLNAAMERLAIERSPDTLFERYFLAVQDRLNPPSPKSPRPLSVISNRLMEFLESIDEQLPQGDGLMVKIKNYVQSENWVEPTSMAEAVLWYKTLLEKRYAFASGHKAEVYAPLRATGTPLPAGILTLIQSDDSASSFLPVEASACSQAMSLQSWRDQFPLHAVVVVNQHLDATAP